jgi:hypothetical protein
MCNVRSTNDLPFSLCIYSIDPHAHSHIHKQEAQEGATFDVGASFNNNNDDEDDALARLARMCVFLLLLQSCYACSCFVSCFT